MHPFVTIAPRPVLAPEDVRGAAAAGNAAQRPAGRLAENIVHFARALRAAGVPVGPGAVLDALAAVAAAGVGTRQDFYWTLHAVLVKRHEHSLIFDQAFRIFFRRRGMLDRLLAAMLPQAPSAEEEKRAARRPAHPGGAALESRGSRAQAAAARGRRAPHRVRPRGAAEEGFRADDRGRDRRRQGRDQAAGALARRGEDAAAGAASATATSSTSAGRCARASRPAAR